MDVIELSHFYKNRICDDIERRCHIELPIGWREQDKYKDIKPFKSLPLESSVCVLKAVATSRILLEVAVLVFMVGFGLYLLF